MHTFRVGLGERWLEEMAKAPKGTGRNRGHAHAEDQRHVSVPFLLFYCNITCGSTLTPIRFRWAACQLDTLERCLDYPSLTRALETLPKTLEETYRRILKAIPNEYRQTARRILQFYTYSARPLRIEEAVDAIAVNVTKSPYFSPENRMPEPLEITRYCSSLVVISPKTNNSQDQSDGYAELQLAHFLLKSF